MAENKPEEKRTRTPVDPTVKAMRDLDRIFTELDAGELSLVLNWALKKHKAKNIKNLITT